MRTSLLARTLVFPLALAACSGRQVDDDDDDDTTSSETGPLGDAQLEALCATGCERFETCAPAQMAMLYGDREGCEVGCFEQYASPPACRAAAESYASCTAALACDDWPDLLSDPATSKCADAWADVAPVCDFG